MSGRWQATPAERQPALLESGGWPPTMALVALLASLAILVGMAVEVLA